MAEMIAQSLNNLNNTAGSQNNKSTKNSKKTEGKSSLAALVDGNEKAKKTFKQLLKENDSKKADNSEKIDFSKLLDVLNLSNDELKEKIKNMDKKAVKDLENMVQVALASILEKINNEQKINNLKEFGISEELLNKAKAKLASMQQLITKHKDKVKVNDVKNDIPNDVPKDIKNGVTNEVAEDITKEITNNKLKLNDTELKKMAEFLDLPQEKLKNKLMNLGDEEINKLKQTFAKDTLLNDKSLKALAEVLDFPKEKLQNKLINMGEKEINKLKQIFAKNDIINNTDNQNNEIANNLNKILTNNEEKNMTQTEKVYYQTLKKQANAENNQAERVSLGLKAKGENSAASQLNSELKANLNLKEFNKNNDLKKLLNRENFNLAENKIKTATNNSKQETSFTNLFSGNQQENNFAQLFGTQNMNNSSNISTGTNNPQFNSSVLQGSKLAKQVTEQIKILNKPANNEIKLQLEPDFLGKVKMDLKVDGGKVTARFMVDNMLVKNHLDQNISQLKSTLINQGFNVDNLEVNAEDSGYDMGREDGSNQFFQGENQKQNQRQFNYNEYEKLKDELLDLSPEQLEKIVENDPEKLRNWGYVQQNDWFRYGGHYQRMNLLA